jgi:holo-[acyl-carrier protein] synthase
MPEQNGLLVGIGVDMCAVSRIEKAIAKEHFLSRVYTEGERAYLDLKGKGRAQSAATMFAAKEAAAKALGTGIAQGIAFAQIEVTHDALGAPGLVLSGAAEERLKAMGGRGAKLSLSHEGDMAIAFVILY